MRSRSGCTCCCGDRSECQVRAGLPLGVGGASERLLDWLCAIDSKGRSAWKGAAATVFAYLALRSRLSASMGSCSRHSRAVCSLARPARWLLARCAVDEVDGSDGLDSTLSSLVSAISRRSRRLDFAALLLPAFARILRGIVATSLPRSAASRASVAWVPHRRPASVAAIGPRRGRCAGA